MSCFSGFRGISLGVAVSDCKSWCPAASVACGCSAAGLIVWDMGEKAAESDVPTVSVVIPCRDEVLSIEGCIDSLIADSYPKDRLEILVVDGMSMDGTREIVEAYARGHAFIRLLDNPEKITPVALNIGITNAKGELIVLLGAHAACTNEYISKCVKAIGEYAADSVGGILRTLPANDTTMAQAIAIGLSHPFGVGNAYFRIGSSEARRVDTVPFGCYRKEVFDRIGLFDERLVRNQDIEFNTRLRKAGGKIYMTPTIRSYYYARSSLGGLWRQSFQNGRWNIYTTALTGMSLALRHFVPLGFVAGLFGSGLLAISLPTFRWVFGTTSAVYLVAAIIASLRSPRSKHAGSRAFLPLVFLVLHLSYGLGSLWGMLTAAKVLRHGH